MADEPLVQPTGTESAPAAAESTPSPSLEQRLTAAVAAPETPSDWTGVRDAVKEWGLDLSTHTDDRAALQYLSQQAQAAQRAQEQLARYEAYFRQQQAAAAQAAQQQAQPAQPEKKPWWNPPEYNPGWRQLVSVNPETGRLEGPADLASKVMAYEQYRRDFADRFTANPAEALKPWREELVEEMRAIAREAAQQNLGGYRDEQFASGLLQQHANWIYARDAQGNPTGGLSSWGQRFAQYVHHAANQMGIQDERQRADYAVRMVQLDYLTQQAQQQAAGQQPAPADPAANPKQRYLAQHNKGRAVGGPQSTALPLPGQAPPPGGNARSKNLMDRLREDFAKHGITEDQLNAGFRR